MVAALTVWTSVQGAETVAPGASRNDPAGVASFDCARASSAREQAICKDTELSALDRQLGRLYREKRALLSPEGAKLLLESERGWLRFVGTVCASDGPKASLRKTMKFCLTHQYEDRIKQLQAIAQVGPYLFNRVDLYAAEPASDDTGSVPGFFVQHVAYPVIDNATSPEPRAWNKKQISKLPNIDDGDCDPSDDELDYELGYATDRLISVEWTHSTYCHGTAHGFWSMKASNTVLSLQPRPLSPKDMFGADEAWAPKLKELFWSALIDSGWMLPDNDPNVKQQLQDEFVDPGQWLFTKDGLRVAFNAYDGGCYACTPHPITLPWSFLRPLLSRNAIVP